LTAARSVATTSIETMKDCGRGVGCGGISAIAALN
jgi:hypothetical protein